MFFAGKLWYSQEPSHPASATGWDGLCRVAPMWFIWVSWYQVQDLRFENVIYCSQPVGSVTIHNLRIIPWHLLLHSTGFLKEEHWPTSWNAGHTMMQEHDQKRTARGKSGHCSCTCIVLWGRKPKSQVESGVCSFKIKFSFIKSWSYHLLRSFGPCAKRNTTHNFWLPLKQKIQYSSLQHLYNQSTMIRQSAFFFVLLAASSAAIELTPNNFYNETDGKTVFIKFFAPW